MRSMNYKRLTTCGNSDQHRQNPTQPQNSRSTCWSRNKNWAE